MKRFRTIAASPVRSATEAWNLVTTLVADTLERSPVIPARSVGSEMASLNGLGPALIAGGHLESKSLVLCDIGLLVFVNVVTAEAAVRAKENLNPVPAGASATNGWVLHVPLPGALDSSVKAAVQQSSHLSAEPPPMSAPAAKKREFSPIDLDALRQHGSKVS